MCRAEEENVKKNCLSLYGFISKGIDKPAKEVQTFLGIEQLAAGAYVVTFLCSHRLELKYLTNASS